MREWAGSAKCTILVFRRPRVVLKSEEGLKLFDRKKDEHGVERYMSACISWAFYVMYE